MKQIKKIQIFHLTTFFSPNIFYRNFLRDRKHKYLKKKV